MARKKLVVNGFRFKWNRKSARSRPPDNNGEKKRMGGAHDADIQSNDKYIHVHVYGVDLCIVERRQRQHIWGTQISELSYLLFIWGLKFHFILFVC